MKPSSPPSPASAPEEVEDPALTALRQDIGEGDGARSGAKWLGSSRLLLQMAQFAFSLITARLLLPEEFGVAALAMVVINFATVFTELGLAAVIVHAKTPTTRLVNTVFWISVFAGLGMAALVALLAYPISQFYNQPQLFDLMLLVSLGFAVSRSAVQLAYLERTYRYKRLAIIETTAAVIGLITTPTLAALGVGPASLVIGPLLFTFLRDVSLWFATPWRPTMWMRKDEARRIWMYSRGLVGFNLLTYWSRNFDTIVLGRQVSASDLGEYNRAFNLMMVPVQQSSWVMGRVLFPALARLNHQPERVANAWLRGAAATCMLSVPLALTMAATAPAAVVVLYGPNWAGMATELMWMSLASIQLLLASSTESVYRALGRTGQLFRRGLRTALATSVAILAGLPWGTEGVAFALFAGSFAVLGLQAGPLFKVLTIGRQELKAFVPVVLSGGALVAAELLAGLAVPSTARPIVELTAQLAAGAAAYLFVIWRLKHAAWGYFTRGLRSVTTRILRRGPSSPSQSPDVASAPPEPADTPLQPVVPPPVIPQNSPEPPISPEPDTATPAAALEPVHATVTVVIPAHNRESMIERCVASALSQPGGPKPTVIVVDDASTDATADRAEQAGARVLRLTQNGGASAARNAGVQAAETEWIAFLDSDDAWFPGALQTLCELASAHPDADILGAAAIGRDVATGETRYLGPASERPVRITNPADLYPTNFITPSATMVRREAILAAGMFRTDLRFSEDLDLWLKIIPTSAAIVSPVPITNYGMHAGQKSRDPRIDQAQVEIARSHEGAPWWTPQIVNRQLAFNEWDELRAAQRAKDPLEAWRHARWFLAAPRERGRALRRLLAHRKRTRQAAQSFLDSRGGHFPD